MEFIILLPDIMRRQVDDEIIYVLVCTHNIPSCLSYIYIYIYLLDSFKVGTQIVIEMNLYIFYRHITGNLLYVNCI